MRVRLRVRAASDLDEIWDYVAVDSPSAATRTVASILKALRVLQRFPRAGRERPELQPGLRCWPVGDYLAFYYVSDEAVEIVRILHGRRDVLNAFVQ